MSFINPSRFWPLFFMLAKQSFCMESLTIPLRTSVNPIIALRGVRISWLIPARNALFALLAAIASPIAVSSLSTVSDSLLFS